MVSLNDPFMEYQSVKRWAGRLTRVWVATPVRALRMWCVWLRDRGEEWMPDELVRVQGDASGRDQYRLLDLLQEWVNGLPLRVASKSAYYQYVRSFFLHNRVELPRDRSFKVRSDLPKYVGSLGVGDLRLILPRCNLQYRAFFTAMAMGGMGQAEGLYWSNHGLRATLSQLDAGATIVKVDLPGRKKGRGTKPFYTFIGRDAVMLLREWLEVRGRRDGAIFYNQFGGPLTGDAVHSYWRRQVLELRISHKWERYGKNPHEMRDLFRTRWQKSGADPLGAEFHMGHIVDANQYNKAFADVNYALSQYEIAEPWLNYISDDPEKVPRSELNKIETSVRKELDGYKAFLEKLGYAKELEEQLKRRSQT